MTKRWKCPICQLVEIEVAESELPIRNHLEQHDKKEILTFLMDIIMLIENEAWFRLEWVKK